MVRLSLLLSLLLLLFSSGPVSAQHEVESLPTSFIADYAGSKKLLIFNVDASLVLELHRTADYLVYLSRSEIKWSFYSRKFSDCSVMKIKDGKLYPIEYQHIDEADDEFSIWVTFDWENLKATTREGTQNEAEVTDIRWPTYDPMSLQVAMMAAAPFRSLGSQETLQVLEKGRIKDYNLQYNGEVNITTQVPNLKTVEIYASKKKGDGAFWLTPDYHWVPAKIRIDDVFIDLQAPPRVNETSSDTPVEFNDTPKC